jgi:hypothetical protein
MAPRVCPQHSTTFAAKNTELANCDLKRAAIGPDSFQSIQHVVVNQRAAFGFITSFSSLFHGVQLEEWVQ